MKGAGPTRPGNDGPGRQKPEVVAPQTGNSYATSIVSGGGTVLIETARTHPSLAPNPGAERSVVIKSVVLAGAEHRAGWANNAPQSGPMRGLATNALDPLYGVDEFDLVSGVD